MFENYSVWRYVLVGCFFALAACTTKPAQTGQGSNQVNSGRSTSSMQSSIVPGSVKDFQINVGDTVYFDYDRSELNDQDRNVLQRQASWLNRYTGFRIVVQGHCDERGTRAYNLALGARRAQVVEDYLASLGVSESRINTISYGKERPVCIDSTEMCWAKNRRGVTTISGGSSS